MDFGGVWEAGVVELEVKIEGEEFASEASFLNYCLCCGWVVGGGKGM